MSGGHFDYAQFRIRDIADENQRIIDEYYDGNNPYGLSYKDIQVFRRAVWYLRRAEIYAHRIDWYLSGDDGPETFHQRLEKELLLEVDS